MTNYTTKRKQALTRKMWGFVIYRNIADVFSYIATATLLQHFCNTINKKSALKLLICL
jgi:hypothetical protein